LFAHFLKLIGYFGCIKKLVLFAIINAIPVKFKNFAAEIQI
jgi:hypothetical protein